MKNLRRFALIAGTAAIAVFGAVTSAPVADANPAKTLDDFSVIDQVPDTALLHVMVAFTMDVLALTRKGAWPTAW